jgi:UDP-2,3-diacylglucosamine pyrophosphatase LpxH
MECNWTQKYYLVSDLHMGGDGALQHCDYTDEFIAFLKGLENEGPNTELLIVGDTFGFWELSPIAEAEATFRVAGNALGQGHGYAMTQAMDG